MVLLGYDRCIYLAWSRYCLKAHLSKSHVHTNCKIILDLPESKMARNEGPCSRTALKEFSKLSIDLQKVAESRAKGIDMVSGRCQARFIDTDFELNQDTNFCPDMNDRGSTGNVSIKHTEMLMGDLLLGLRMLCIAHCGDELFSTIRESVTYFPESANRINE